MMIGVAVVSPLFESGLKARTITTTTTINTAPAAITFDKLVAPPLAISTVADCLWAAVAGLARLKLFSGTRAGIGRLMFVAEARVAYELAAAESAAGVVGTEASTRVDEPAITAGPPLLFASALRSLGCAFAATSCLTVGAEP